jgi:hypothetical protein
MDLVEVWFGVIERRAIHRGSFRSVDDPTAPGFGPSSTVGTIDLFASTKTAQQILAKANLANNFRRGALGTDVIWRDFAGREPGMSGPCRLPRPGPCHRLFDDLCLECRQKY